MTAPAHRHGPEELYEQGRELYGRALREGHVSGVHAEAAPCPLDFGLLRPVVPDPGRPEPVAPAVAPHRLPRTSADRIADERRREQRPAETFEPLMRIDGRSTAPADLPALGPLPCPDRLPHRTVGDP